MKLGSMDHALICSGPMSTFSYDSHPMSRGRMVDELPRVQQDKKTDRYSECFNQCHVPNVTFERQLQCSTDGPGDTEGGQGAIQGLQWDE